MIFSADVAHWDGGAVHPDQQAVSSLVSAMMRLSCLAPFHQNISESLGRSYKTAPCETVSPSSSHAPPSVKIITGLGSIKASICQGGDSLIVLKVSQQQFRLTQVRLCAKCLDKIFTAHIATRAKVCEDA